LVNLPLELGSYTQSDNPATFIKEDSTDIKVLDLSLEFIAEEYLKCEGENLILDATIPGAIILWNGEETDPVKIITGPGTCTLEARNNCEIIIKTITVTEEYVNVSTFQTEYDVMLGEYLDFNIDIVTNSNTSSILWNDPNGNSSFSCIDCEEPNLRPLFDAIYSATVTSEAGCIDIVDINVHVDKQRDIFAPNIFSPNGDGSNDIFYLTGTEFVTVNEFNIFDRWGNLVYSTISKELGESNEGWSGDYNGYPVNPGVYVWYAEVEWLDGHIENIAGDVTVLR
jgi:gliding motility-associated-like protein